MSVVMQISEAPRPQIRRVPPVAVRPEGSAQIYILPCIRREPIERYQAPADVA